MSVHDFDERLAYSHGQSDMPYWDEVYKKAFPDMVGSRDLRHDGWHQRAGRDRVIDLSSGKTVFIDEKVRPKAYGDILVEIWSRYPKRGSAPYPPVPNATEGWGAKPLDCDFLAYAFESTQTCYLLPFLGIRAAWGKHGRTWRCKASRTEDGYRWVVAENRSYVTVSIAVPIPVLQSCINDALTVTWTGSAAGNGHAA